ncbi:MAG: glycosyltransferase family 117 protein [Bacteroidota bacterium]
MDFRRINLFIGLGVFFVSFLTFWLTVQPSVSFWDCGEFSATAYTMAVPHPPGAPLFLIVGRFFQMIPFVHDPGLRINTISVLASAFTVMFLYFIVARLIKQWRGEPKSVIDLLIVFGSAVVAALTFNFSDTFWFNAVESEVYASSMFFVSSVVLLALMWYEHAYEPQSERYLLLIAYLMGLSIGVHQLSLLAFFTVAFLIYIRYYEVTSKSFIYFSILAVLGFGVIFPGIVNWLPDFLDGKIGTLRGGEEGSDLIRMIPIFIIAGLIYLVYWGTKQKNKVVVTASMAAVLIVLGYATYAMVIIRANAQPPVNENNPSNLNRFVMYINREQYGEQPSIFNRMWNPEPEKQANYRKYSGPWDFFWRYQLNHMYLRYLGWNFIGRAGDIQDAPVALFGSKTQWSDSRAFPNRYFALPFILGLIGVFYHFKKSWKFALALLALFVVMGFALVVYFNMAEPQPRERDYFYVGSFFAYAIWVGLGAAALLEFLEEKIRSHRIKPIYLGGALFLTLFIVPVNMAVQNWWDHDRSRNYIPWDYSYNLLQSCEKNAILFTNGDNDTFPLWYLQEVAHVRTDVRVANLSLIQTPWYVKQLKHERPHGALPVPISLSDDQIDNITQQGGVLWKTREITLPVPPEVFQRYGVTDTAALHRGGITFTVQGTKLQGADGQPFEILSSQSVMVLNIIQNAGWDRPVYFAVTTLPESRIGLEDYLRMDGLAYKVTPVKRTSDWQAISPEILSQQVMYQPEGYYTDQHYGFKFRGLNDSTLYIDDNAMRLTLNYRNAFLRLALYYANAFKDTAKVLQILNKMDEEIPDQWIPMDYRLLMDVANFYNFAGDHEKYLVFSKRLEQRALRFIEMSRHEPLTQYNPYVVLMNLYDSQGEYEKEIQILRQIKTEYGDQRGIPEWTESRIQQLEGMVKAQNQGADTSRGVH